MRYPAESLLPARLALMLLGCGLLAGCIPDAVDWDGEPRRTAGALADSLRMGLTEGTLEPVFVAQWTPPSWPAEPALCAATLRAVQAPGGEAFASWFAVRADSSVVLRVARSDDGGRSWNAAVSADSTDVGRAGCARPVPYIAADSLNGYVHLVYHLDAREGAGLFFTHTMERGALFHAPVPIVYGDRPSVASVASRGDTVVVAYEDPNSRNPRVGLAISRTQGHIFERRLAASDDSGEARTPRVAVRGTRVAIAWTATQRGGTAPRTVIWLGTLLW
jgi:hypothetical protein